MRIFLLRLFHETNTFAPGIVGLDGFSCRTGPDVLSLAARGSLLDEINRRSGQVGVSLQPCFDLGAPPGPVVSDEVVQAALQHIDRDLPRALAEGLDGIFLILHGAMVSQSHRDVEGLVLARVASHLSGRNIPVAAILDLHANVSPAMARHANILLAYRCNPHTDAVEAGLRCFDLLVDTIQNTRNYHAHLVQSQILLPPVGTDGSREPMAGLLEIARKWEKGAVAAISICAGFSHADTPDTGLSFLFVAGAGAEEDISRAANELLSHARENATQAFPREWVLDDAIRDALAHQEYPALIVEPADNIGGGSPGDARWVLDAFLRHDLQRAAVVLSAPDAVAGLRALPAGSSAEIVLGGNSSAFSGPEIRMTVKILHRSDGVFEAADPLSHFVAVRGTRIDMGPSVLVQSGGATVLLTSKPTPPMDLAQWRSFGVAPENLHFIGIKAAVAHRQAYDPIARRTYTVATPGPCTSNLKSLEYKNLRRPMFPIDPLPDQLPK